MTNASEIRELCMRKDRAGIKRLLESIPRASWKVTPDLSEIRLSEIMVRVWHHSGGSGINTYEKVLVCVDDEDLDGPAQLLFSDTFTCDELKIANYIPKEARHH